MGLEVGTYISDLVVTNPVGASDAKSQGDDHLRLIKSTIKNTFPNISGAMTLTHTQLNNAAIKNAAGTFTAAQTFNEIILSATTGIHRDIATSGLILGGGTSVSNGANLELYGGSHATDANDAFLDADALTARTAAGGSGTNWTINGNLTVTGTFTGGAAAFPSGTRMPFQQTAAPTGWTKDLTHNNKAMRLVTGSVTTGGTSGFTGVFTSRTPAGTLNNVTSTGTVQNHTLTAAQMPSHTHGVGTLGGSTNVTGSHSHTIPSKSHNSTGGTNAASNITPTSSMSTDAAGDHSHTLSITGATASAGSDNAHNHGLVMDAHSHTFTGTVMDFAVQYVDFIIAQKD